MRKFLLTLFSVLLFACLGAAVACSGNKDDSVNYYTLVFRQTNGVTYECDVPSGWEVKEGVEVSFKVKTNSEVTGEPIVYANQTELTANNQVYTVVMSEDTTIRVDGLMAQGSEYNKLEFVRTPGVTFNGEERKLADGTTVKLESGMFVRMHETISFSLVINPKYDGTPRVYANTTLLTPNSSTGMYSLEMIAPTTITVEGLKKKVELVYQAGDTRVEYYQGEDDVDRDLFDSDATYDLYEGDEIAFKVHISVYYRRERDRNGNLPYTVLANSTILHPDDDGYYHYTLSDDTVIKVNGLEMDVAFVERANGGSGTMANPFRISRPIDLYQMAMFINGGFYTTGLFYAGYYTLENDIDMEGEQLFIIGDGSTGYSVFSGTFYGNGHTISNYVMNDLWIDQENFNSMYITNVGFFGYVVPTSNSIPAVYNLNLDSFTIVADASVYPEYDGVSDYNLSVGAFAGVAYGIDMVGCSATNGQIFVTAGDYGAYVGGLIGQQVSAYSDQMGIQAYSGVTSCYADVDVSIIAGTEYGFAYAAGGITGFLAVGEEHLTSYILNSYSTGNVAGALNAGGVVGYTVAGSSIINCYSTGIISAYSHFNYNSNWNGDYAMFREYYNANAGGITGRAGFNTVIYNCFFAGAVSAKSECSTDYERVEAIAAYIESGNDLQDAHSYESSIVGCQDMRNAKVDDGFIRNTMNWSYEDWVFDNGMPAINYDSSEKEFTITFVAGDDFGPIDPLKVEIKENGRITGYMTMSMWNTFTTGGIPEYKDGENGMRSYAYFFDAELTQRVFYGFIPTDDMTLYLGYANYSEVAGTYYFGESAVTGARIELDVHGNYTYYNGALIQTSIYTYDGENITLYYAYLGELADFPAVEDSQNAQDYIDYYLSSLYIFGAKIEGGRIVITGGYVQEVHYTQGTVGYEDDGTPILGSVLANTGNSFYLFTDAAPLTGMRAIENFKYGTYYYNGETYNFYGNGTGVRTANGRDTAFTYTVNGNNITIKYSNSTENGTIDGDGYVATVGSAAIKPYDGFTGTWEREFNMNESYTFNGKSATGEGEWTYTGYGNVTATGKYTVDGGVLTANDGTFSAIIDENGFIQITNSSATNTYYMGGSFAGEWYYSHRLGGYNNITVTATITLNGIANNGYGTATAEYGTGDIYELTYQAVEERGSYTIYIYRETYLYASLTYVAKDSQGNSNPVLTGTIDGYANSRMTAYDIFKGLWVSDSEEFPAIQFNGNGFNNLDGITVNGAGPVAVRATAYNESGKNIGTYYIDHSTMVGTLTYAKTGVIYTLTYNELSNIIEVKGDDGSSFTLLHRDSWYGRQLENANGVIYTFQDGKGHLAEGGTMTTSDGKSYTYYLNEDDTVITLVAKDSSYAGGTISVKEYNGEWVFLFETERNEKIALTRHTAFTGEWMMGGEPGNIYIGKIYANDKAEGWYKFYGDDERTDVVFTYNFKGDYLTFEYEDENGTTTMYINALIADDVVELSIGTQNSTAGGSNSICVSTDRADDYYGMRYNVYDTKNGVTTGQYIVFDGLSNSVFGYGTAVMYNADGTVAGGYIYSIEAGAVQLIYNYWAYYMVEQSEAPNRSLSVYELLCVVDENGNYFILTRPDSLAGAVVSDADNSGVYYTFNGVGGVVRTDASGRETTYTYSVMLTDNVLFKHVLQFTAADGTIYSATLDQSTDDTASWTITLVEADEYFGLVGYDSMATAAYFVFDGAGRVVRLSNTDSVMNYTYELISDNGGVAIFTFKDETNAEYTATFDHSSSNEADWTITLERK